jgi:phenylpropionate dioxygenase-like ring-hydroxylating dioxygenase large terminal subunit
MGGDGGGGVEAGEMVMTAARQALGPDLRRIGIHPDHWYPVARAAHLKTSRTLAVRFAGERIVLARTEAGEVFALEDRCAHRQMPLSMGVVEGERLRCGYHGWLYSKAGRCVGAPYLPDGASVPRGVRPYPSREACGHVFIFPGDPSCAQHVPLPDIPTWGVRTHRTMYFAREVKCHYSFIHENLMDMTHQFLHRSLMGGVRPSILETRAADDRLEVDYRFERPAGGRRWAPQLLMRGKAGGPTLRDHVIMTVATRYPYQELSVRLPGSDAAAFNMWSAYVPLDRGQETSQTFGMLMIRKPAVPALIYLAWPFIRRFTEAIFAQDRIAVEAEQRAHDEQGADWNYEVSPLMRDLKALLIRRGVALGEGAQPPETRPGHPQRASTAA